MPLRFLSYKPGRHVTVLSTCESDTVILVGNCNTVVCVGLHYSITLATTSLGDRNSPAPLQSNGAIFTYVAIIN